MEAWIKGKDWHFFQVWKSTNDRSISRPFWSDTAFVFAKSKVTKALSTAHQMHLNILALTSRWCNGGLICFDNYFDLIEDARLPEKNCQTLRNQINFLTAHVHHGQHGRHVAVLNQGVVLFLIIHNPSWAISAWRGWNHQICKIWKIRRCLLRPVRF